MMALLWLVAAVVGFAELIFIAFPFRDLCVSIGAPWLPVVAATVWLGFMLLHVLPGLLRLHSEKGVR